MTLKSKKGGTKNKRCKGRKWEGGRYGCEIPGNFRDFKTNKEKGMVPESKKGMVTSKTEDETRDEQMSKDCKCEKREEDGA